MSYQLLQYLKVKAFPLFSISLYSARKAIFLCCILFTSIFVIFPWSVFLFNKLYQDYLSASLQRFSTTAIAPIQFGYEYPDVPGFTILRLNRSEVSQVIKPQAIYDVYLELDGYCNQDTSSYVSYSLKSSLIPLAETEKLLLRHHQTHNRFPYHQKSSVSLDESKSTWPLSKYLPYEHPKYFSSEIEKKGDFYYSNSQSFVFSCGSTAHPFVPPIFKSLLPPFLYEFGLSTLTTPLKYMKRPLFKGRNHLALKALDLLQISNETLATDLVFELNTRALLIDGFTSHVRFQRVRNVNHMSPIMNLVLDILGWLVSNEILVYTAGTFVVYSFSVSVYVVLVLLGYYFFNTIIVENLLEQLEDVNSAADETQLKNEETNVTPVKEEGPESILRSPPIIKRENEGNQVKSGTQDSPEQKFKLALESYDLKFD